MKILCRVVSDLNRGKNQNRPVHVDGDAEEISLRESSCISASDKKGSPLQLALLCMFVL